MQRPRTVYCSYVVRSYHIRGITCSPMEYLPTVEAHAHSNTAVDISKNIFTVVLRIYCFYQAMTCSFYSEVSRSRSVPTKSAAGTWN